MRIFNSPAAMAMADAATDPQTRSEELLGVPADVAALRVMMAEGTQTTRQEALTILARRAALQQAQAAE